MSENNNDTSRTDLKAARENSGLTLKELFERTRISVVNLEAIENGDFHLLPVPIYTRNFIKTYAEALGVDSSQVLENYEKYLQTQQVKAEQAIEEPPEATGLAWALRYKAYLWTFLIIFVFAGVVFFVYLNQQPESAEIIAAKPLAETAASEKPAPDEAKTGSSLPDEAGNLPIASLDKTRQTGAGQNQPASKSDRQMDAASGQAGIASANTVARMETIIDDYESRTMIIYATEETWIRIQADDKETFQVLLKPGERISRRASKFNMDIGNAGGIRIQFDGQTLENLGSTGQVIHLHLP